VYWIGFWYHGRRILNISWQKNPEYILAEESLIYLSENPECIVEEEP
jgi:hypothetical protein